MAHFLKKLELNGFKSFAGKTVLEFPSGITAIVGPNGSGKSNVVDAVRWLLGERDAKNLRGAKVEDLIFAGTAKKARLGQAQASLHFENKNNFFPVDFAEVSVTRQVARDGMSRYFLNKSEILLRDLVDFFAKARLGSRGMIVVTQGESDVFLRATPAERREMIEEILGLREYQIKKSDAERRLKNSRINLDKAKALTEEILPHLRSLRRQTARWEKRGSLEEELKNTENRFFGARLREIKDKSAEVEEKIGAAKSELAILEKEKKSAETKQAKVEASEPVERKDLQKIKEQTQDLLQKQSVLQKELGRLEAQIEIKQAQGVAEIASAAKLLELLKKVKSILLEGARGDTIEMQEAIRGAIEEIDDTLDAGAKSGAPAGTAAKPGIGAPLKSQLEKIQGELKSLENEMRSLEDKEKELEKNQEQFYRLFKAAVAEVEAAKNRIEKWQAKNQEILFEKERLRMALEEWKRQAEQAGRNPNEFSAIAPERISAEEMHSAEQRIFKLRGDLASIGEVDEALMKEAKETESRYEFLKKESEDLERAVKDLKVLIADLREKIKIEFEEALTKINSEFGKFFNVMFGGGQAKLKIIKHEARNIEQDENEVPVKDIEVKDKNVAKDAEAPEEGGGVEIDLHLPRKKINSLEMLSGGERSLVGIAALFAMISVSPPPFLVLDEIDAALDERNAKRFAEMLKEFSRQTQFVVVTHNRATMEAADVLYGVTLSEDGTSKILSLKLEAQLTA